MLKHGEVQRNLVAKAQFVRPTAELLGPLNRYRDENFERYKKKRRQFYDACRKYNKLNQETLISSKNRLHEDYRANINCEFLIETDDEKDCLSECVCEKRTIDKGQQIRKRTERRIHHVEEQPEETCQLEPWFKRYLTLNKFIWAARTCIIKNRLEKVLERLKSLTAEDIKYFEKQTRTPLNVSYAQLFQKFM